MADNMDGLDAGVSRTEPQAHIDSRRVIRQRTRRAGGRGQPGGEIRGGKYDGGRFRIQIRRRGKGFWTWEIIRPQK